MDCKQKGNVSVFNGRYFEFKSEKDKKLSMRIIKKDIFKILDYTYFI